MGTIEDPTAEECLRGERRGVYDVTVRRSDGRLLAEFRGHSHTGRPQASA